MPKFLTTHWGTYEIIKGAKRKIALKNWKKDPSPSEFGLGFINSDRTGLLNVKNKNKNKNLIDNKYNKI